MTMGCPKCKTTKKTPNAATRTIGRTLARNRDAAERDTTPGRGRTRYAVSTDGAALR
jgi:hypothetical protein